MGSKFNVRNRTVTVNVILTWRLRESRKKKSVNSGKMKEVRGQAITDVKATRNDQ